MEEIEVILVPSYNMYFNVLTYPLTEFQKFEKHFSLNSVQVGPISQNLQFLYKSNVQNEGLADQADKSDQKPMQVELETTKIPNRTFMTACRLVGNRLYVFPIRQFARVKPRLSHSVPQQGEKRTQADELIFQRNKAKFLEMMKKSYQWQKNLKDQEVPITLVAEQLELPNPIIKERNILNLKVIPKRGFQQMLFDSQEV